MERYDRDEHINVGTGVDVTIRELAELVREVVFPEAELVFDTSKPDGTPRKLLDVSRLAALGWAPQIDLQAGIASTYDWFVEDRGAANLLTVCLTRRPYEDCRGCRNHSVGEDVRAMARRWCG